MFEHVTFPASRWQVTQRSVHTAHPGSCAWTAGSFGGTGGLAGASGTMSADGNVCSAAQFPHGTGASAAPAAAKKADAMTVLANMWASECIGDEDFTMFGLGRAAVLGRTPFQPGDQE